MLKKIIITVLFIIVSFYGIAQKNLNDYKYIIIPKSFQFSKGEDQYQLNSLLKFLFNKYGYEAYFKDELPEDLNMDRCLGLMTKVSNGKGGMFKTKLEISLNDCYDTNVMTSKIGESRLKQFDKAYTQALRDAFETFKNMDYKYVEQAVVTENPREEKQQVSKTIKVDEKEEVAIIETKSKEKTKEVKLELPKVTTTELYYAQAILNGFQIVNSEPRVVMILLTTSAKNVFIVKDKNAIVYKKNDKWIYSENDGTTTSDKALNIKF